MQSASLVSIIIPTYNRTSIIGETIKSVFAQEYRPIELIIVDDGSTDNTREIVNSFLLKGTGVSLHYINNGKKGGNVARNVGIRISKGEYIQFFDSDDIMMPNFISSRMDVLSKNDEIDYCGGNWCYFDSNRDECYLYSDVNKYRHDLVTHLKNHLFPTPAFLLKKTAIIKIGYWDEVVMRLQDIDYFSRLFYLGLKGYWIDEVIFKIRKHQQNISADHSPNIFRSSTYVYRKIEKECIKNKMYDKNRSQLIGDRILENSNHCYTLGYYSLSWKFFWLAWLFLPRRDKHLKAFYFIRRNIIRFIRKIPGLKK